jgi:hypothetical protein
MDVLIVIDVRLHLLTSIPPLRYLTLIEIWMQILKLQHTRPSEFNVGQRDHLRSDDTRPLCSDDAVRQTSEYITPLRRELHWLKVPQRVEFRLRVLAYRCLHGEAPAYLAEGLHRIANIDSRHSPTAFRRNSLPPSITNAPALTLFHYDLKMLRFQSLLDDCHPFD